MPNLANFKIARKGIQIASKKLTPYVGKKIAQTISKNATVGAAMGALHGSTSAIIDKKPHNKRVK